MLSFIARKRTASGQVGVFATHDGVAAARVHRAPAGARPRLEHCLFAPRELQDPLPRVAQRLAAHRVGTVNVLEPSAYQLLLVDAPDVPHEELRAAVRWRIKDLIDYPVDQAVIDVFEMPAHARGPSRMMYAVAARAEVVKRQVESVEAAGLRLDVIDIAELALRNVATLLEEPSRGAALLYVAEHVSLLLLVRQGVLYLTRRIETGSRTLADAGELRTELAAGLALEVRRSLDYFESHYEQTAIHALYTSGLEPADREALARDSSVAVHDLDLARVLDSDVELPAELARRALPAIGAALRQTVQAA